MRYIKECKECPPKKQKSAKPIREEQKNDKKPADVAPTQTNGSSYNKTPVLELPHFLRVIGPKQIKVLMQFVPSAITYGITSLVLLTYMADWKTVLQYLPYYNGKFVEQEKTSTSRKKKVAKKNPEEIPVEVEEEVKADAEKRT